MSILWRVRPRPWMTRSLKDAKSKKGYVFEKVLARTRYEMRQVTSQRGCAQGYPSHGGGMRSALHTKGLHSIMPKAIIERLRFRHANRLAIYRSPEHQCLSRI